MSAVLAPRLTFPAPVPTPDPVRVCFMIDRLSRAGTETQLLALVRELDRSHVQPSLVLLDGEDDLSRALEPADCPVIRLGVRKLLSPKAVSAAGRLRAFWREHRPDVLQVYFLDAAYLGAPLAKMCGIRKVLRVRIAAECKQRAERCRHRQSVKQTAARPIASDQCQQIERHQ